MIFYEYKYLLQGNTGDGWFDIMSFSASMSFQDYIDEEKNMHPTREVRIVPNPKWDAKGRDNAYDSLHKFNLSLAVASDHACH